MNTNTNGQPIIAECKGCGGPLRTPEVHNSLSRYGHGYICSDCGMREAFDGDFIKR